jgi:Sigma-70 region 2
MTRHQRAQVASQDLARENVVPGARAGERAVADSLSNRWPPAREKEKRLADPDEARKFKQSPAELARRVYNLARWLLRDDQEAQDAVQNAFSRAIGYAGGFRGGDRRAWLLAIVRNVCYTQLSRSRAGCDGSRAAGGWMVAGPRSGWLFSAAAGAYRVRGGFYSRPGRPHFTGIKRLRSFYIVQDISFF